MIIPFLFTSGCNSVDFEDDQMAPSAVTLVVALVADERLESQALLMVQDALNRIIEPLLNARLHFVTFTEEEYVERLIEMSEATLEMLGTIQATPTIPPTYIPRIFDLDPIRLANRLYNFRANGDIYFINEGGRQVTVFPTPDENQLDIILINNAETYNRLVYFQAGAGGSTNFSLLRPLNELIENTTISQFINTVLMARANQVNPLDNQRGSEAIMAIPNNVLPQTRYNFMIINRALFDYYQYDINIVNYLRDLEHFLLDIVNNEPDVIPIFNYNGFNWFRTNQTGNNFPILGVPPVGPTEVIDYSNSALLTPGNVFREPFFRQTQYILARMRHASGHDPLSFNEPDFTQKFAVGFIEGDAALRDSLSEDFYVITLQRPFVGSEMFEGMYAVSHLSLHGTRAAQVIEFMKTDREFVNLLTYGIPGIHHDIDANGQVVNRRGGFYINRRFTGNIFLQHQSEDMDERLLHYSANNWAAAKQIGMSYFATPFVGFFYSENISSPGSQDRIYASDLLLGLEILSETINELWMNFRLDPTSNRSFSEQFSDMWEEIAVMVDSSSLFQLYNEPTLTNPNSPAAQMFRYVQRFFWPPAA